MPTREIDRKVHMSLYVHVFDSRTLLSSYSAYLPPLSLFFKVKAIAAGTLDGADSGAIEPQECLTALRTFEVFLNHGAFFLSPTYNLSNSSCSTFSLSLQLSRKKVHKASESTRLSCPPFIVTLSSIMIFPKDLMCAISSKRVCAFQYTSLVIRPSLVAVCPILSNLAFGVELHPKAKILLCLAHGSLCRV